MNGKVEVAMSCRAIREKLNEALAAGEAEPLNRGAVSHLQACGDCRHYYSAQSRLFGAIDSGVRRLVEDIAPPSLVPGVRERLAAAEPQPNRAWVRALLPSAVALLVACGLLLLVSGYRQKAEETRTALVQPASNYSSVPDSEQSASQEASAIVSNSHPTKSRRISRNPERPAPTQPPVILDPREIAAFAPMTKELAKNPDLGLSVLRRVPSTTNQPEAIEPLNIAELEIPVLAEETK